MNKNEMKWLLPQARKKIITALNQAVNILRTLDLHLWQIETRLSQLQFKTRSNPCFTPRSLSS